MWHVKLKIMFNIQDVDKYKEEVVDWSKQTNNELKDKIDSLGIKRYGYSQDPVPLKQAVKGKVYDKNGLPSVIGFKMPKTGIWVQKGVSRGHLIANPREAKDWYNSTIEKEIDKLGDIVMNNTGNMIVNALKIF